MPEPTWREIRAYLDRQLAAAQTALVEATDIETIWRTQGTVRALTALRHLDQALALTRDQEAPNLTPRVMRE
jgi:hypothetical protein